MFFDRHGLNPPLVTSPTCFPSAVSSFECPRAGAPVVMKPTRLRATPDASCCLITSPPMKSNASRRRLPAGRGKEINVSYCYGVTGEKKIFSGKLPASRLFHHRCLLQASFRLRRDSAQRSSGARVAVRHFSAPMVHASPASTGEMSSVISLP